MLRLVVIVLVAVLQVWSITTITQSRGGALKAPLAGSMMLDEEEADEATLAEPIVLAVTAPAPPRSDCEQRPPAPVHLEPDGRPPSA